MKPYKLLLVASLLMFCMSCEKEDEAMFQSQLLVSAEKLNFDQDEVHQLLLSVEPSDTCSFRIVSYPSWVSISPLEGMIDDKVQITVSRTSLQSAGQYSGSIKIHTRFGESVVAVERFVEETGLENYLLDLPDSILIDEFTDQTAFSFTNEGITAVEWTLETTNDFLSIGQTTGTIDSDTEATIDITVNRENFETGNYYSDLILSSGSYKDTIPVRIYHFKEYKIKLQEEIVDAAYSRTKNALVYVASNPLALYYYDMASGTSEKIELTYVPTCVALDKNTEFAVVGHDAHVSYVDLVNKTVISTVDVTAKIIDIVFADNGWAYCSPGDYNHNLIGINLSEGTVVRHTGYATSSNGKINLDATGKYIYMADRGVTPSDLHKFNIQSDTALYLYDSPYHGDYSISGDLWLSEDGSRIFTRGGNVFKTSEVKTGDMAYNGELDLYQEAYHRSSSVFGLDHNANTQKVYLIAADGYDVPKFPYLFIHSYENLLLSEKIALEKYITRDGKGGGAYYEPEPYFVFSNSVGDEAYVITKAYESGLLYEWAIQKVKTH